MVAAIAPMLRDFLRQESAGGIVLIFAAALALVVANSPLLGAYRALLDVPVVVGIGGMMIDKPLLLWINDGLMAVFFFLVGLEVKREVLEGQLSSWDRASLPLVAAIGGMAAPALVFLLINADHSSNLAGWAIPSATDIAFALGVLALLGSRVPVALKALLLAIAVIDDIGAIVVIALFYSGQVDTDMLLAALATLAVMAGFGRMRVGSSIPYVLLGIVLWVFVLKSGVHATLAGVAAALTVPMVSRGTMIRWNGWNTRCILGSPFSSSPLFGLANAGVSLAGLKPAAVLDPLSLGVALGLLVGKQVGIVGFAFVAERLGIARLPSGIGWRQLHALSLLAAIGFTMSLFIGNLAFADPDRIDAIKIGVLSGSFVAALAGYLLMRKALAPAHSAEASAHA